MIRQDRTGVCEEFCAILVDRGGCIRCRDCGSFFSLRYKKAIFQELELRFFEPSIVAEEFERLVKLSRRVSRLKGPKAEGMTFYSDSREAPGGSLVEHTEGWHE